MKSSSNRHKLVGRLVLTSLTVTSIFGVNSFFFSFSQNKLSNSIKYFEALDALLASTSTDKISNIANLKKNYSLCQSNFPSSCESYFTALIQTRNRIKDYQITFTETLNISKEDPLLNELSSVYEKTNLLAKESFGLSFEEAKKQKIVTSSDYINIIKEKRLSIYNYNQVHRDLFDSVNNLYTNINKRIKNERNSSQSIPLIMKYVNWTYLILVLSEISLFGLVACIDIINNNASVISGKIK